MSVDFYVAVPAAEWPTVSAVEQCITRQSYPVQLKRFPGLDAKRIVSDGVLASLDGGDAYLEGSLYPGISELSAKDVESRASDVKVINGRLSDFQIGDEDALFSIHVRSANEMRVASYLISSLIVCFHGYGFEPQGNTHGRTDFAQSLLSGVDALKGF